MLLSFRFANHRSFRDEQQLNLLPVYGGDDPTDGIALTAVPVVGIFGANASGKSNIISAFVYLSDMVGRSDRESEPGRGVSREPFRLDTTVAKLPSSYAVDLLLDGVQHTYGFTVDDDRVVEEWLYAYPLRRKRVIFDRSGQHFDWGEESGRSAVRRLADIVAPTALFLSVSARFDPQDKASGTPDETAETLHRTFSWLWRRVSMAPPTGHRRPAYSLILSNPDSKQAIIELLKSADVGLKSISSETVERDSQTVTKINFLHHGAADDVIFNATHESSGTLRLLEVAGAAVPVLNSGGLFLIDEIDASLHPLLTTMLIRLFRSREVNRHGAQLVFTTHDATLLGSIDGDDVLERDQVWFTSKRDDGSSELFSLAEFKPRREGENRLKRYLNGSYGAIPELSMRLFEQAILSRADSGAT